MINTTILIAEDSRTQAETLRLLLEEHGYDTLVARHGEAALALLSERPVDLVISDIMMPGMDGYELCRAIKAHPEWGAMPVLLLTSLNDPMDIIRGLESGADNFLTKPYDPDQLLERTARILENRRLRRPGMQMGLAVSFLGQSFVITADKQQILDLLISTFEDAVIRNKQLVQREEELERARAELVRYAGSLEERLERVLESVPDIVYSISTDRRELYYMSDACRPITGFTAQHFAGDPAGQWEALVAEEHRERVLSTYRRVAASGIQETMEYPLHGRDNVLRWIEETIVAVRGEDSRVVRLDCVARDITGRRQLEEQVRLAQKMEAVGTLAAGIAHDFNNLLTAIQGNAELACMDVPERSTTRQDLEEILQVTRRATMVARQLLALGRRQMTEPRAVDLHDLIGRSATMLRRFIGDDIDLRVSQMEEPAMIWADPDQIDQVLMNLSVNARHAMPGGGTLLIATSSETLSGEIRASYPWLTPGEYVCLRVTDAGTGMTPAVQARIFEPFFTTKQVGEGTGLGLAVVYGIIKQHGGMIEVESEPGFGTTFRIYLPLHTEAGAELEPAPTTDPPRGSETILYVEDDQAVRKVTARRLRLLGYTVLEASNGGEALERLNGAGENIELVMTDVMMPGMGGAEVFRRIRESHPDLRFLFMTGHSPTSAQLEPLSELTGAVLHKPFGIHDLAIRVREILQPNVG